MTKKGTFFSPQNVRKSRRAYEAAIWEGSQKDLPEVMPWELLLRESKMNLMGVITSSTMVFIAFIWTTGFRLWELSCIKETSMAAGERVIFTVNAGIAKVHRRVRVMASDWGAEAVIRRAGFRLFGWPRLERLVLPWWPSCGAGWWACSVDMLWTLNIFGKDRIFCPHACGRHPYRCRWPEPLAYNLAISGGYGVGRYTCFLTQVP